MLINEIKLANFNCISIFQDRHANLRYNPVNFHKIFPIAEGLLLEPSQSFQELPLRHHPFDHSYRTSYSSLLCLTFIVKLLRLPISLKLYFSSLFSTLLMVISKVLKLWKSPMDPFNFFWSKVIFDPSTWLTSQISTLFTRLKVIHTQPSWWLERKIL